MSIPAPTVDYGTQEEWSLRADEMLQNVLEDYKAFHRCNTRTRWKMIRKAKNNFAVYTDCERQSPANTKAMIVSGLVPGTMREFLSGLYAESSDTYRTGRVLRDKGILDAKIIHVFENDATSNSIVFAGVKWTAHRARSFLVDRDILFYERLGWVEDENMLMGYQITFSVTLCEMPANVSKSHVRFEGTSATLFRQVNEGWVDCFTVAELDTSASLSGLVIDHFLAHRGKDFYTAMLCARAKAYSSLLLNRSNASSTSGNNCSLCKKPPKIFRKLRPCAACKSLACKPCRDRRIIFRLDIRSHRPVAKHFCMDCIEKVEGQPGNSSSTLRNSQFSQVSAMSAPWSIDGGRKDTSCSQNAAATTRTYEQSESIASTPNGPYADSRSSFWGQSETPSDMSADTWQQIEQELDWNPDERQKMADRAEQRRKELRDLRQRRSISEDMIGKKNRIRLESLD